MSKKQCEVLLSTVPWHRKSRHCLCWDGGELNSGSSAWKSIWGKVLLSFKCSVGKGGGVRLGSELLLCLTASINGAADFPASF